jgi:hypothetical protein
MWQIYATACALSTGIFMTTPYSNLESKVEQACLALIQAQQAALHAAGDTTLDGINFYTGQSSEDMKLAPNNGAVIMSAVNSNEEEPQFSGNWFIDVSVGVIGKGIEDDSDEADPKPAYDALVATVFDLFNCSNLAALLTTYGTALSVQGFIPQGVTFNVDGITWHNELNVRVLASPSAL